VFKFQDTLTSRAEIGDLSALFKDDVVALIGLGGTGAYVLQSRPFAASTTIPTTSTMRIAHRVASTTPNSAARRLTSTRRATRTSGTVLP
jgi:hypothetical protein